MNIKKFRHKTVVITGGASGIGFSFAKAFGREGANIVISDIREERLTRAESDLTSLGINTRSFVCNVTSREEVVALADFAWHEFGEVNVILNNAGAIDQPCDAITAPIEEIRRIMDVNFFGVWHGVSVFGARFIEQGKPSAIYNVGSENSLFVAVPMHAAYVASKHAVLGLTDSLREDVPDFIDVGLICPGFVRSEISDPEVMALGMDTDEFTALAVDQIKKGEFLIVSHSYNKVRIDARYKEIAKAFDTYAPRQDGDAELDGRKLLERFTHI